MEDADSDSGFDSDGDWYHAGRDIVHGLRTNSNAVGPDGEEKGRHPVGMPLFSVAKVMTRIRYLSYFKTGRIVVTDSSSPIYSNKLSPIA